MEKVIDINNVTFSYDTKTVLKEVSLEVFKGDFIGIVGPNGSAKTTLIKLLLGILEPQQGSIQLLGQDVKSFSQWHRLGYIAQKARDINGGFPATVEEIVAANLYMQTKPFRLLNKGQREKIDEVLNIVDIGDYKKRLIGSLSGGQQQRVFIARALVNNPELIIMDEPLVGVDVASQERFYGLMELLNKSLGITLAMVSHDIGVITDKTNKVACLGNQSLFVHDSKCFNQTDYIKQVYGEGISLLHHQH